MALDPSIALQGSPSPNAAIAAGVNPIAQAQGVANLQQTQAQTANLQAGNQGIQAASQQAAFAAKKQQDIQDIWKQNAITNPDGTPAIDPTTGGPAYNKAGVVKGLMQGGYGADALSTMKTDLDNTAAATTNATNNLALQQKFNGYVGVFGANVPDSHAGAFLNMVQTNADRYGIKSPFPALGANATQADAAATLKSYIPASQNSSMTVPENQTVTASQAATHTTPDETNPNSATSATARNTAAQYGVQTAPNATASQIENNPTIQPAVNAGNQAGVNMNRGAQAATANSPQWIADKTTFNSGLSAGSLLAQRYPGMQNVGTAAYTNAMSAAQNDPAYRAFQSAVARAKAIDPTSVTATDIPGQQQQLQQFMNSQSQAHAVQGAAAAQGSVSGTLQATGAPTAPAVNTTAPLAGSPAYSQQNAAAAGQANANNGYGGQQGATPPTIMTADQYAALPSGASYIDGRTNTRKIKK